MNIVKPELHKWYHIKVLDNSSLEEADLDDIETEADTTLEMCGLFLKETKNNYVFSVVKTTFMKFNGRHRHDVYSLIKGAIILLEPIEIKMEMIK